MKEINYIHKNDVFIETTASFISWLSFDLARFLKVNEDDHDLLIKNIHLVEARKALLRKLNGYISDMDIQTDNQKNYQKIDLNVRYAIACGKTALDKPLINNFSQDISNFDTSSVTRMDYMFYLADDFNQDLSGLEIQNVSNMKDMLDGSGLSTAN